MEQEISELRRKNAHLRTMSGMYQAGAESSAAHGKEMFGTILTALIDPDSGINKTARIVSRARLAVITED